MSDKKTLEQRASEIIKQLYEANWGTIDSPRGESIFVTGVPKSIMRRAVARLTYQRGEVLYLHVLFLF